MSAYLFKMALLATKPVYMPEMGCKCMAQGAVLKVSDTVLGTGSFDQLIDRGVVHMADTRKQMVLHLKIKSAE